MEPEQYPTATSADAVAARQSAASHRSAGGTWYDRMVPQLEKMAYEVCDQQAAQQIHEIKRRHATSLFPGDLEACTGADLAQLRAVIGAVRRRTELDEDPPE
ncbi:hypothetical protein F5X71_13685 [Nocardia brasiliensis]|uniref:Uncharacterized protein n=1 Tax=Nocardia brasiliensis TaxID=37326 RepID=A0A6G9XQJ6_NOCBR|nr:hypothetical protein [Nocardia brasiliensis]QIS03222.1 hypothetical protein F5X71_13685 [Nocardia brasiliensis]